MFRVPRRSSPRFTDRPRAGLLALALVGCAGSGADPAAAPSPQAGAAAGTVSGAPLPPPVLDFTVAAVASGLAGAQAPARRAAPPGGTLPGTDTGAADSGLWGPGDTGDPGSTEAVAACDEAVVGDLSAADAIQRDGGTALFVVPPIFDLGVDPGLAGHVARPVAVVAVDATGCTVRATLSDDDSSRLLTGFASEVEGMAAGFVRPAGLMMDLIVQDDALWLFSNNSAVWWSIDPDTGTVTAAPALAGAVGGAAADGSGGAWVSLAGKLDWPDGSSADVPATLIHLDATGSPDGTTHTLPFTVAETGFGRLDALPPEDDPGTFTTWLTPHYLSNDLALGPDGRVWVLDSEHALLAAVDTDSGAIDTVSLPLLYPTGIASEAGQLVVTAGLEADRATGTVHQSPGLYTVDPDDGSVALALALPAPDEGWDLDRGFVSLSAAASSETRGIYRDAWLGLEGTGTGALIVADPKAGRLVIVE